MSGIVKRFQLGDEQRARQAMEQAHQQLNTPIGVRLMTPPYDQYALMIQWTTTFPPGAKENGGIFCHAIVVISEYAGIQAFIVLHRRIDKHDLQVLEGLVRNAGREELVPRFASVSTTFKADGSLITEADLAVQRRLQAELAGHWPQYALLGEEMDALEQQRLLVSPGAGLWCLDPLDGRPGRSLLEGRTPPGGGIRRTDQNTDRGGANSGLAGDVGMRWRAAAR